MNRRNKKVAALSVLLLAGTALSHVSHAQSFPIFLRPVKVKKETKPELLREAPKVQHPGVDLSLEEARQYIPSFNVTLEPTDSGAKLRLFGALPESVSSGVEISTVTSPNKKGFRIHLSEKAYEKLKELDLVNKPNRDKWAGKVFKLSSEIAPLNIKDSDVAGEFQVGLAREKDLYPGYDGEERNRIDWSIVDGLKYKSLAVREREALEEATRAEKEQKARLFHEVQHCRRSEEELEVARAALSELEFLVSEAEYKKFAKQISLAELRLIQAEIKRAPREELPALQERISAWVSENGTLEANDQGGALFAMIAARHRKENNLVAADEVLDSALDFELSEGAVGRIQGYKTELQIAGVTNLAMRGMQGNFALMPALYQVASELQNQVAAACNYNQYGAYLNIGFDGIDADAYSPASFSMEGCMRGMAALQRLGQIPQMAQSVDMRRFQMQQQIAAALNPSYGQQFGQQQFAVPGSFQTPSYLPYSGQSTMFPGSGAMPLNGMPSTGMPFATGMPGLI